MKNKIKSILLDSNLNELLSKAGVYLGFRVLGFLLAYLFAFLVIKEFGSEAYGFITLGFTFIVIGSVITRIGYDVNLTRLFSSNALEKDKKGIYFKSISISILVSLVLAGILYALANQISTYVFINPNLTPYLEWAALTIPFWSITMINTGVFRGLKRNGLYSFFNTFGRFLFATSLLAIILFLNNKDAEWAIIAHFFGVVLLAVISLVFIIKIIGKTSYKSTITLKTFTRDSTPILMAALVIMLLDWSDKIFIGIYEDESKVGVYDIVFRIAILIKFTLEAINSILAPKISELYYKNEPYELQKIISFSTQINTYISVTLFIGLVLFSTPILLFLGEEFLEGKIALLILAFGQLIGSLSGSVGIILQMTGNQKTFRSIALVALIFNLILNLILVKYYSIIGAAIATTISLMILNVTSAIYIKRKLKIKSYYSLSLPKTKD